MTSLHGLQNRAEKRNVRFELSPGTKTPKVLYSYIVQSSACQEQISGELFTQMQRSSLQQRFYEKYRKLEIDNLPRYVQLRETLISAIEDGFWGQGDQLPPEAEIAKTTPFSLGTVQKALKALVDDGILVRRQGSGTFVAENRRKMDRPWHCRFESDQEGIFLPVYPKVLLRKRIRSNEKWAELLDADKRLLQIDRRIRIGDEFNVYCRIFLSADKFSGFLKKKISDLESKQEQAQNKIL